MRFRQTLMVLLCCVGTLFSASVNAHTIKDNSAQVIIRDGQIELRLLVNIEHWVEKLTDPESWLVGDTEILYSESDSNANTQLSELQSYLANQIKLVLNSQAQVLVGLQNESLTQGNLSADGFFEFRFSAAHTISNLQTLSVVFPKSIGDVYISVVQPSYGLVKSGEQISFSF